MFHFAKFRWRNFSYGALWLVSWPMSTNVEWSVDMIFIAYIGGYSYGFRKYFQCESAYFLKKIFKIFILK